MKVAIEVDNLLADMDRALRDAHQEWFGVPLHGGRRSELLRTDDEWLNWLVCLPPLWWRSMPAQQGAWGAIYSLYRLGVDIDVVFHHHFGRHSDAWVTERWPNLVPPPTMHTSVGKFADGGVDLWVVHEPLLAQRLTDFGQEIMVSRALKPWPRLGDRIAAYRKEHHSCP